MFDLTKSVDGVRKLLRIWTTTCGAAGMAIVSLVVNDNNRKRVLDDASSSPGSQALQTKNELGGTGGANPFVEWPYSTQLSCKGDSR